MCWTECNKIVHFSLYIFFNCANCFVYIRIYIRATGPCGFLRFFCLVALLPISPNHSSCSLSHFLPLSVSWSSECIVSRNKIKRLAVLFTHLSSEEKKKL